MTSLSTVEQLSQCGDEPCGSELLSHEPHPAAPERRGVEPGKARFIIDVVLAIHRRAMPRWLAEPDTTSLRSWPKPPPNCAKWSRRRLQRSAGPAANTPRRQA
ncbi:hypothetical protein ACN6K5_001950 [Streptomyces violaceoruber]